VIAMRIAFAVPGDLNTATGGYGYDRRIMSELKALGWLVEHIELGDGFPWPTSETRNTALDRLEALSPQTPIVIDGLAFGVMAKEAELLADHFPLIALVHHPLALENGLSAIQQQQLWQSETAALAHASHVVVTSPATAKLMLEFNLKPERISTVLPGTQRYGFGDGSKGSVVQLLSVGTLTPRKGFDVLIEALATLKNLAWHLTIVGDGVRDPACAADLAARIIANGLTDRIIRLGTLSAEALSERYRQADVFVLASHFEGYGMAYAEAMAHGLPVIGTTGGAIPGTVPASAGLLVEPGNVQALAGVVRTMVEDETARARFAAGARATALSLPSWEDSARLFAHVLRGAVAS